MSFARRPLIFLLAGAAWAQAPWAPARAQNLDAGKPPSQIFSEVCANCHRSTREVRNASSSFLREHYTTGSEMASSLANYLAGAGGPDPRAPVAAQPKRPPAPATAATGTPAAPDAKPSPAPATATAARGRPTTADARPSVAVPPAPARPVLEEFEE